MSNLRSFVLLAILLIALGYGYSVFQRAWSIGRDPATLSEAEKSLVGNWVLVKQKNMADGKDRWLKQITGQYKKRSERGTEFKPHNKHKLTLYLWKLTVPDSILEVQTHDSLVVDRFKVNHLSDSVFIYTDSRDSLQYFEMRYTGEFLRLPKAFWQFPQKLR